MDKGLKSYVAEFLGTFTLCFIGQAAIVAHNLSGDVGSGLVGVAIAHGLALAVMITALGAVSGGHFNPAVTFGFLVTGRHSIGSTVAYWVSQLAGAVVATFVLSTVVPQTGAAANLGAIHLGLGTSPAAGVVLEVICSFLLVTVVWGTAVDNRAPLIGGFGIGLTVLMCILAVGQFSGAAFNPARAFGAALVTGNWADQWVWWVGPMIGGAIAALLYRGLFLEDKKA